MERTRQDQGRKKRAKRVGGAARHAAAVAEARDPAMYAQRLLGKSLQEIADEFGVDISTVSRGCDRAMAAERDSIEVHRDLQVGRVKRIHKALLPKVDAGDTDAARTILLAEKRLADLLGLDAAKKHELAGPGGTPLLTLEAARALIASDKAEG